MGRPIIGMVNCTGSKNGIMSIPEKIRDLFDQFLTGYHVMSCVLKKNNDIQYIGQNISFVPAECAEKDI